MKKLLLISALFLALLHGSNLTKDTKGFIMSPKVPSTCLKYPVEQTSTGYLFTGRIIWGDPAVNASPGEGYANGLVFVSEGKTREWEFVVKTDEDGYFSVPIKPFTQFKLYAWSGSGELLSKYEGHFYYNSDLGNLYRTPTDGEPTIEPKGDVIVIEVINK